MLQIMNDRPRLILSGGDILNVCLNAICAGSASANPADWKVTQDGLVREIKKVQAAKRDHGNADSSAFN